MGVYGRISVYCAQRYCRQRKVGRRDYRRVKCEDMDEKTYVDARTFEERNRTTFFALVTKPRVAREIRPCSC